MSFGGLRPGTEIAGRFVIERQIGSGGMGTVYSARQLGLERPVAIKVISPEEASKPMARKRFEREARVASALRHPNAVEIYDFGRHENTMYLAMELLDGSSLRSLVDVDLPPLSTRRACQIASDVADVLASAASISLVHRDLKPENIILDRTRDEERTVVVDFGLAYILESEEAGRMTRHGEGLGTPDYLSPEQARGLKLTPACDVYSLGCVLYEMLSANVPFDGQNAVVLSQHLFVAPPSIRERFPAIEIPSALDELILRMLSKSPADRPSAVAVFEALRSLDPRAPQRMGENGGDRLLGRPARMVSAPPIEPEDQTMDGDLWFGADIKIAVCGPVDPDLKVGLAANGIDAVAIDPEPADVPLGMLAVFAPGASAPRVAALADTGLPVLSDAAPSDIARLADMLRAGASEVVIQPCAPEELARKVWRAVRKG
jgi:serine/threonine-protein kinase